MRATRLASSTAIALGLLALAGAASPALAADGDSVADTGAYRFTVTPSTMAAGGQVTLTATGCPGSATVTSGAFDTVLVPAGRPGRATIGWDATPGTRHDVAFLCNGTRGTASLTVAEEGSLPTTSSTSRPAASALPSRAPSALPSRVPSSPPAPPVASASASAVTSAAPARGVRGGLGGSIDDMDGAQAAGGAALVLLGACGCFYAVRRRSTGNRRR